MVQLASSSSTIPKAVPTEQYSSPIGPSRPIPGGVQTPTGGVSTNDPFSYIISHPSPNPLSNQLPSTGGSGGGGGTPIPQGMSQLPPGLQGGAADTGSSAIKNITTPQGMSIDLNASRAAQLAQENAAQSSAQQYQADLTRRQELDKAEVQLNRDLVKKGLSASEQLISAYRDRVAEINARYGATRVGVREGTGAISQSGGVNKENIAAVKDIIDKPYVYTVNGQEYRLSQSQVDAIESGKTTFNKELENYGKTRLLESGKISPLPGSNVVLPFQMRGTTTNLVDYGYDYRPTTLKSITSTALGTYLSLSAERPESVQIKLNADTNPLSMRNPKYAAESYYKMEGQAKLTSALDKELTRLNSDYSAGKISTDDYNTAYISNLVKRSSFEPTTSIPRQLLALNTTAGKIAATAINIGDLALRTFSSPVLALQTIDSSISGINKIQSGNVASGSVDLGTAALNAAFLTGADKVAFAAIKKGSVGLYETLGGGLNLGKYNIESAALKDSGRLALELSEKAPAVSRGTGEFIIGAGFQRTGTNELITNLVKDSVKTFIEEKVPSVIIKSGDLALTAAKETLKIGIPSVGTAVGFGGYEYLKTGDVKESISKGIAAGTVLGGYLTYKTLSAPTFRLLEAETPGAAQTVRNYIGEAEIGANQYPVFSVISQKTIPARYGLRGTVIKDLFFEGEKVLVKPSYITESEGIALALSEDKALGAFITGKQTSNLKYIESIAGTSRKAQFETLTNIDKYIIKQIAESEGRDVVLKDFIEQLELGRSISSQKYRVNLATGKMIETANKPLVSYSLIRSGDIVNPKVIVESGESNIVNQIEGTAQRDYSVFKTTSSKKPLSSGKLRTEVGTTFNTQEAKGLTMQFGEENINLGANRIKNLPSANKDLIKVLEKDLGQDIKFVESAEVNVPKTSKAIESLQPSQSLKADRININTVKSDLGLASVEEGLAKEFRPVTRFRQTEQTITKPAESVISSSANRSLQASSSIEALKSTQDSINALRSVNLDINALKSNQAQIESLKSAQAQIEAQAFVPLKPNLTVNDNTFIKEPPFITGFGGFGGLPGINKRKAMRGRRQTKLFTASIKRFGKFIPIATNVQRASAYRIAQQRALGSLGRTINIKESGVTFADIPQGYAEPDVQAFREYRIVKGQKKQLPFGTFIKRRGITSIGSIEELRMARAMKASRKAFR